MRKDDMLTIQVDGTHGSAVVGPQHCYIQSLEETPVPVLILILRLNLSILKIGNWYQITKYI
jgi:hypothetical protein